MIALVLLLLSLLPSVAQAQSSPYPDSTLIESISWDCGSLTTGAAGSDLFPATWHDDGHLYVTWGDGGGFENPTESSPAKSSFGVSRLTGTPASIGAQDILCDQSVCATNPASDGINPDSWSDNQDGGKHSGIISVSGTIYGWHSDQDIAFPNSTFRLAWSIDDGAHWTLDTESFSGSTGNFIPRSFLQFGQSNAGARDTFVYFMGYNVWSTLSDLQSVYMGRAPVSTIQDKTTYEYFSGTAISPAWSSNIADRTPIFTDPAHVGRTAHISYIPGIDRYLLTVAHWIGGSSTNLGIGLFEGPEPWGPWQTVEYRTSSWCGQSGDISLGYAIPTKESEWLSTDGTSIHVIYSGTGSFDQYHHLQGTLELVPPPPSQHLAFPSAEGYGRFSTGGRGGTVHLVTNTNNAGAGSLRACIDASGPRTCVFRVSGTITASTSMRIRNPGITIAGQTAPGGGIQIRLDPARTTVETFRVEASDTIIRHVRFRAGDAEPEPVADSSLGIITRSDTTETSVDNVILDHVSMQWGVDTTFGIQASTAGKVVENVTVQNSIISDGLSTFAFSLSLPTRAAGVGGPPAANVSSYRTSLLYNLIGRAQDRNPLINAGILQFVNNVIFCFGVNATGFFPTAGPLTVDFINNYIRRCPASPATQKMLIMYGDGHGSVSVTNAANSHVYLSGNIEPVLRPNTGEPETDLVLQQFGGLPLAGTPYADPNKPSLTPLTADAAYTSVLGTAGAFPRDSLDTTIMDHATNGTGGFGGGAETCCVWPTLNSTAAPTDTDSDGMPDTWETDCSSAVNSASTNHTGLSPTTGSDGAAIVSATGYSALEHYLNELAGDYPVDSCGGLSGFVGTTRRRIAPYVFR